MPATKPYPTPTRLQAPQKEPPWFWVVIIVGFLSGILLFAIGWYLALPSSQKDAVTQQVLSAGDIFPGILGFNRSQVLLVMGVDMPPKGSTNDYKGVRTDTMMLVKLDHAHHGINIVSIPRDSKVILAQGHGIDKINSAFAYGGPDLAMQTVKQTLGIDVDHYLVINLRGVREVVDALGGIDVYVEKPMHYQDNTAGLYINLEPGQHHMDGRTAEGFLRFRHDALGDIGRIRRQQEFMKAVSQKIKDPAVLLKIKPLVEASNKYLLTNLSTQDLIRTVLFAKELDRSKMQVATLPGGPSLHSSVSYWVIDPKASEEVLNRLIVGVDENSSSTSKLPKVGILYTPGHATEVKGLRARLETRHYEVICDMRITRSNTRLITHNTKFSADTASQLQKIDPLLSDAQLIFAPHGATYEANACGGSDYTIILGDDTRSAVNP